MKTLHFSHLSASSFGASVPEEGSVVATGLRACGSGVGGRRDFRSPAGRDQPSQGFRLRQGFDGQVGAASACRHVRAVFPFCAFIFAFLIGSLPAAEPANDGTAALRAALRDKTQQLATVQSDLATLQAGQAALENEKKALLTKFEAVNRQMQADKTAGDKSTANLNAQLEKLKQQNAQLSADLEKSKSEGEKAAQAARLAQQQGDKLAKDVIVQERRAADMEAKNLALFLVANEILTRYEEFSLGNAIRAKEPFVGNTRTKLENLVQAYQDKILDQRVKP